MLQSNGILQLQICTLKKLVKVLLQFSYNVHLLQHLERLYNCWKIGNMRIGTWKISLMNQFAITF